jgi:hypothetical protein
MIVSNLSSNRKKQATTASASPREDLYFPGRERCARQSKDCLSGGPPLSEEQEKYYERSPHRQHRKQKH